MALSVPHKQSRDIDDRLARWIVCALVLVAFALGVWKSDAKSIWWDESLSLLRAQGGLHDILINRITFAGGESTDQHPPLYFLLLRAVISLAGENDVVLRFPSACMAAALVPLLYILGKRLRNSRAGVIAAGMGALSPFMLWYAQEARMYTLVTFLGLLSTYVLWRAITSGKWYLYLLYGITLGAGLLTQYLFVLLFPAQLIFALALRPAKTSQAHEYPWQRWTGIAGLAIPLGILLFVILLVIQRIPELGSNRTYVPLWMITRDAFNSFALGLSVNYFAIWPLDIVFWLVFTWGLVSTLSKTAAGAAESLPENVQPRPAAFLFLLGYIFLPIIGIWLFSFIKPLYMGSRYLLMCVPAFILGVALGLESIISHRRILGVIVLLVLLGSSVYSICRYYTAAEYKNKEDYRSAACTIAQNESAGDVIVVNGAETEAAFKHYYEGNLSVIPIPELNQSWEDTQRELNDLAQRYDRLWLVEGNKQITDPTERVRYWFTSNTMMLGESVYSGYVYSVRLSSYFSHPTTMSTTTSPKEALGSFAGQLQLDTFSLRYLDADGQPSQSGGSRITPWDVPASVPAGRTIGLMITMTVQVPLQDYKTSLRLLDNQGRLIAQRDEIPYIYFPSSKWPVGQAVLFQAHLRIPLGTPPGNYQLALLIYQEANGQALRFTPNGNPNEQEWYKVADIQVSEGQPYSYEANDLPDQLTRLVLPARFGPIQLLGYKLPEKVQAGDSFTLPMFWQAVTRVYPIPELGIEWRDSSGQRMATAYLDPVSPGDSLAPWPQGAKRRMLYTLTVPQDAQTGSVSIYLTARLKETGKPYHLFRGILPAFTSAFRLGTIEVDNN
ncbi:MAG: glycosyltransferase family 39 protein [Chloroflexi bacterium]|nr:glycosyltransferase family 39 protein [Chloroflexota bacterium]